MTVSHLTRAINDTKAFYYVGIFSVSISGEHGRIPDYMYFVLLSFLYRFSICHDTLMMTMIEHSRPHTDTHVL